MIRNYIFAQVKIYANYFFRLKHIDLMEMTEKYKSETIVV